VNPGEAFAAMTLFLSIATVFVLRGPLGRALAERMSGRRPADDDATREEIDNLKSSLDDVRHRLAEAEDRLDFAERLLAKQRQQSPLGPGE
jgi:hypothetical protein